MALLDPLSQAYNDWLAAGSKGISPFEAAVRAGNPTKLPAGYNPATGTVGAVPVAPAGPAPVIKPAPAPVIATPNLASLLAKNIFGVGYSPGYNYDADGNVAPVYRNGKYDPYDPTKNTPTNDSRIAQLAQMIQSTAGAGYVPSAATLAKINALTTQQYERSGGSVSAGNTPATIFRLISSTDPALQQAYAKFAATPQGAVLAQQGQRALDYQAPSGAKSGLMEAIKGIGIGIALPFAAGAFAAGTLAAGADTLTLSTVGDAALPSVGISIAEVPTVIEAVAAPALVPEWTGIASAVSNSAMVGEEVVTAAAAAAGTIPAASSAAALSGFSGFLPAGAGATAGITLGDAATVAKAASSVASAAASAAKILGGASTSPAPSSFTLRPGTGSTAAATQATPTSTGLFGNVPVATVVLIAGVVLLALKFTGKG